MAVPADSAACKHVGNVSWEHLIWPLYAISLLLFSSVQGLVFKMMALIIKSFNLGFTSLNFIADSSVPGLMDTKENMLRWTDFKRSHFSHSSREEGSAKGALGKRHIFFFKFFNCFWLKAWRYCTTTISWKTGKKRCDRVASSSSTGVARVSACEWLLVMGSRGRSLCSTFFLFEGGDRAFFRFWWILLFFFFA